MWILISLSLLGFSQNLWASEDCQCRVTLAGQVEVSDRVANEQACWEKVMSPYLKSGMALVSCKDDAQTLELRWGCASGKEIPSRTMQFSCEGVTPTAGAKLVAMIQSVPGVNEKVSQSFVQADCESEKRSAGQRGSSAKTESLKAEKIRLSYQTEAEMKAALRKLVPGAVLDRPLDGWEIALHLPNDNKAMGLIDQVFDHYGNDFGNTHGIKLSVSKGVEDGYHLTVEYSSNLYTQRASLGGLGMGLGATPSTAYQPCCNQYFLEENLLKLVLDNKDQNKPVYFKAGVGWQELNNEKMGGVLTSAARQQKEWHELIGYRQYTNIGRGSREKGLYVEGAVGYQGEKVLDTTKRIKGYAEVGAGGSTISTDIAHVRAEAGASLDYQPLGSAYAARIGVTVEAEKYKGDSLLVQRGLFLELGKESFKCGSKLTKRRPAKGPSYREFDNDGDLIMDVYCKKVF